MANILYANNAAGTLASGITNVSTTLTLTSPPTAFPTPTPPQVFYVTLTDAATQTLIEIVQVTAVAGNVFSIVRAQDGTSALSWNAGDIVSQRTIALELRGFENAAEGNFAAQNVAVTPSTTLGIVGTTTANNANAGAVGEFLTATAGPFPLGSGANTDTISVTLTPGDWDVQGLVSLTPAGGATTTSTIVGLTTTSGVFGGLGTFAQASFTGIGNGTNTPATPVARFNVSVNTTVRVEVNATFAGGTMTWTAFIRARRVR